MFVRRYKWSLCENCPRSVKAAVTKVTKTPGPGGLGSLKKDTMQVNADGSVDLYFGPNAPPGLDANWIPTMGKVPYVWLRLYGPEEAFWKKTQDARCRANELSWKGNCRMLGYCSRKRHLLGQSAFVCRSARFSRGWPNQPMKPTVPLQNKFSEFAITPCRGLSLSR